MNRKIDKHISAVFSAEIGIPQSLQSTLNSVYALIRESNTTNRITERTKTEPLNK